MRDDLREAVRAIVALRERRAARNAFSDGCVAVFVALADAPEPVGAAQVLALIESEAELRFP